MTYYVKERYGTYTLHDTEALFPQAMFSCELMRHLAIATTVPDGEDSSGRQKFRLMRPPEVIERATQIAALAWANYGDRGWLLDVPKIEETNETQQPK